MPNSRFFLSPVHYFYQNVCLRAQNNNCDRKIVESDHSDHVTWTCRRNALHPDNLSILQLGFGSKLPSFTIRPQLLFLFRWGSGTWAAGLVGQSGRRVPSGRKNSKWSAENDRCWPSSNGSEGKFEQTRREAKWFLANEPKRTSAVGPTTGREHCTLGCMLAKNGQWWANAQFQDLKRLPQNVFGDADDAECKSYSLRAVQWCERFKVWRWTVTVNCKFLFSKWSI